MTPRRLDPERLLLAPIRAGIALVLLTPLVTAPWTLYPFSVGKALWARTLIAAVFALWTVLALARPGWRPPRSILLALLAAGLVLGVLSAWFGIGPQRSLWSTYERMQGVVNAAHWAAFAIVVASVTRTPADWTRLLNVNLGVGLAVSAFAIVRYAAPGTPLPFPFMEGYWPRIGASTGNPLFLGAYLQAVALLAVGLLVRSCCAAHESASGPAPQGGRAARRSRKPAARRRAAPADGWGRRLFWAATLCCALFALSLTASLGALLGLGAGLGTACALYALFARARLARRLGLAGLGALGAGALALALVLAGAPAPPTDAEQAGRPALQGGNAMLERATSAEWVGFTAGNRLRSWKAGLAAFAERPLLGWGPENYHAASARYLPAPRGRAEVLDRAHNLFVEEAATRGGAGLAVWLALWALTALLALRTARRIDDPPQRALAVFAAAALAGWFVQGMTSFYSAETRLQHMLLLAFLARLEAELRTGAPASPFPRRPAWLRRFAAPMRAAAGAAAICAAGASVASSAAIHAGAAAMWRADHGGPFIAELRRAIGAFEPLANGPRIVLFNNLALNWDVLDRERADEAARLLALADDEAGAALAAEPENWVLHHALARLYLKVAATRPDYAARARHHLGRSLALAPNLDPMEAPLPPARPPGRGSGRMPAGTRVARSAPHANQSVRPSSGARMARRRTQCRRPAHSVAYSQSRSAIFFGRNSSVTKERPLLERASSSHLTPVRSMFLISFCQALALNHS